jgi:AraC family carnitine catabolism transcriptional activator
VSITRPFVSNCLPTDRKERRVHCAGGVARLNIMLDLIGALRGEAMANEVANALVHSRRNAEVEQRSAGPMESDRSPLA